MSQRIITALIALPVLIASILLEVLAPLFIVIALAALTLGLHEFWVMAKRRGFTPDAGLGFIGAALLAVTFVFSPRHEMTTGLLVLLLALVVTLLIAATLRGAAFEKMIACTGATLLGVCYVFLLGGHLLAVRWGFRQALAADLLSFFFLVLMGSDTGAYFAGRALGKRKLAPKISPGKTWEGAAGGLLASLCAAAVAHYWFFPELPLKFGLPLAAAMNVLGVLGDLTESALKRGAALKDSGNIFPGHGGLLDRLDSLIFNAPLLYYFARVYFPY
jgi:phosphatidate cytidylyltransferase